jgi:hypothetical protein
MMIHFYPVTDSSAHFVVLLHILAQNRAPFNILLLDFHLVPWYHLQHSLFRSTKSTQLQKVSLLVVLHFNQPLNGLFALICWLSLFPLNLQVLKYRQFVQRQRNLGLWMHNSVMRNGGWFAVGRLTFLWFVFFSWSLPHVDIIG